MKKTHLFLEEEKFEQGSKDLLIEAFEDFNPNFDNEPGLGAGASGLVPEIMVTFYAIGALYAAGFIGAIGADHYKILKNAIQKTRLFIAKPTKISSSKIVQGSNLLMWVYFDDTSFLIFIPQLVQDELGLALNKLPEIIDNYIAKNRDQIKLIDVLIKQKEVKRKFLISRVYWSDGKWQIM